MSDEAAFLEALKANPADDTTRLVYADWLDERNEPEKAAYLRAVVALACSEDDYANDRPEVRLLVSLVGQLRRDWRTEAGSRFQVVFYECRDKSKKIQTIKCLREVNGAPLGDAKRMFEEPPSKVLVCVPFEQALGARDHVHEAGKNVVRIHPCELTLSPVSVLYQIVVSRVLMGPYETRDSRRPEATTGFATFLQAALRISPSEAQSLAQNERITIAENLELSEARTRSQELERLVPSAALEREWTILVRILATTIPLNDPK